MPSGDRAGRRVRKIVQVGDERPVKIELALRAQGKRREGGHLLGKTRRLEQGGRSHGIGRPGGADSKGRDPGEFESADYADDGTGHGRSRA